MSGIASPSLVSALLRQEFVLTGCRSDITFPCELNATEVDAFVRVVDSYTPLLGILDIMDLQSDCEIFNQTREEHIIDGKLVAKTAIDYGCTYSSIFPQVSEYPGRLVDFINGQASVGTDGQNSSTFMELLQNVSLPVQSATNATLRAVASASSQQPHESKNESSAMDEFTTEIVSLKQEFMLENCTDAQSVDVLSCFFNLDQTEKFQAIVEAYTPSLGLVNEADVATACAITQQTVQQAPAASQNQQAFLPILRTTLVYKCSYVSRYPDVKDYPERLIRAINVQFPSTFLLSLQEANLPVVVAFDAIYADVAGRPTAAPTLPPTRPPFNRPPPPSTVAPTAAATTVKFAAGTTREVERLVWLSGDIISAIVLGSGFGLFATGAVIAYCLWSKKKDTTDLTPTVTAELVTDEHNRQHNLVSFLTTEPVAAEVLLSSSPAETDPEERLSQQVKGLCYKHQAGPPVHPEAINMQ